MTAEPLPPAEHRIDLWYVQTDETNAPALLEEYRRLLTAEENERAERFDSAEDGSRFLVARALVRTVLSRYSGRDPRSWRFVHNAYGKPFLAEPRELPLEFNVAHTAGLVGCAVAHRDEIGLDVEDVTRSLDGLGLARRFFAPQEVAGLEGLSANVLQQQFYAIWTLKEAYIKARGLGLAVPLCEFAFSLPEDRPPQIAFLRDGEDTPESWQFARLLLAGRYQFALAVRRSAADRRLAVEVRHTVPLREVGQPRRLPPSEGNCWTL